MKLKMTVLLMAIGLGGCAVSPESKLAWEVKPVMDVRHGMAESKAYFQVGKAREAAGHVAGAQAAYERALAVDPNNVDAMNALGALYAERGDLDRAAGMYKRVAEKTPMRAYLYNNIGYALHLQGKDKEAIEALRQAVTLDPEYQRAWVNLEKVARHSGNMALATLAAKRSLVEPVGSPAASETLLAQGENAPSVTADAPSQMAQSVQETPTNPTAEAVPVHAPTVLVEQQAPEPTPAAKVMAEGGLERNTVQPIRMVAVEPKVVPNGQLSVGKVVPLRAAREAVTVPEAPARIVKAAFPLTEALAPRPIVTARLEVSNGNGVPGFASRVRGELKQGGVGVARLTNFTSFSVMRTVIEYRQGFAEQADSLRTKLSRQAIVREVRMDRPGTDIRLILGTDWVSPRRIFSEADGEVQPTA